MEEAFLFSSFAETTDFVACWELSFLVLGRWAYGLRRNLSFLSMEMKFNLFLHGEQGMGANTSSQIFNSEQEI